MKVSKSNYIGPNNFQDISMFFSRFGYDFLSESQQFLLNGSFIFEKEVLFSNCFSQSAVSSICDLNVL